MENLKEKTNYSEGGILSKVIIKDEKLNTTLFSMAKGTEILEHTSTKKRICIYNRRRRCF